MDLLYGFFDNVKASKTMVAGSLGDHKEIIRLFREGSFEEAKELVLRHIQEVNVLIAQKSKQQSLLGKLK